jgi:hypothetical protein
MGEGIPERITGNEQNTILADHLANIAVNEREALVELLREWFSLRIMENNKAYDFGRMTGQLCLALEVTKRYGLKELRPDIELLIKDTRAGKTYLPYYADMIEKYLSASTLRG